MFNLLRLTIAPLISLLLFSVASVIGSISVYRRLTSAENSERRFVQVVCVSAFISLLLLVFAKTYYRIYMDEAYYAQMALNFKWGFQLGLAGLGDWQRGVFHAAEVVPFQQQPLGPMLAYLVLSLAPVYPLHIVNAVLAVCAQFIFAALLIECRIPRVLRYLFLLGFVFFFETVFWFHSGALEPLVVVCLLLFAFAAAQRINSGTEDSLLLLYAVLAVLPYVKAEMFLLLPAMGFVVLYTRPKKYSLGGPVSVFLAWTFPLIHLLSNRSLAWGPSGQDGPFAFKYLKNNLTENYEYLIKTGPAHVMLLPMIVFFIWLLVVPLFRLSKTPIVQSVEKRLLIAAILFLFPWLFCTYNFFYAGVFNMFGINHRYLLPQFAALIIGYVSIFRYLVPGEQRVFTGLISVFALLVAIEFPRSMSFAAAPTPTNWWFQENAENTIRLAAEKREEGRDAVVVGGISQLVHIAGLGTADLPCLSSTECFQQLCRKYSEIDFWVGPWTPADFLSWIEANGNKLNFSPIYQRKIQDRFFGLWRNDCSKI